MKIIIYFFAQLLFLPHLVVFFVSKNKNIIIADLYARKSTNSKRTNQMYDLTFELLTNTYFRTLFYFRTPGFVTNILRIFYPKNNSFIIDITTKIGSGLQLAHPYSTILNADNIGDNVYVNHLVTIGEKNNLRPKIGNNVQLNAGCIVIGGITIGDNVIVGAGAVVVKNVPQNCTVVGNPARILELKTL